MVGYLYLKVEVTQGTLGVSMDNMIQGWSIVQMNLLYLTWAHGSSKGGQILGTVIQRAYNDGVLIYILPLLMYQLGRLIQESMSGVFMDLNIWQWRGQGKIYMFLHI